ncbi:MAG: GGDEF domain-containing protein [Thermoleophilaceae bacterium]|nr:GGDEF domain-containing protein [Thermoleophilaceae bacterium]
MYSATSPMLQPAPSTPEDQATVVPVAAAPKRDLLAGVFMPAIVGLLFLYALFIVAQPSNQAINNLFNHYVANALVLIPALVCLWHAVTKDEDRVVWAIIGVGITSWFIGDTYWTVFFSSSSEIPSPSIADAFYLMLYPAMFIGLVLLVKRHRSEFRSSMWMHGVIAALATAAVYAALVLDAGNGQANADAWASTINLTYVIADIVLLMLVVAVWALSDWRPGGAWLWLGLSLVCLAIADSSYFVATSNDRYVEGGVGDFFWYAAPVCVMVAATKSLRPKTVQRDAGHWVFLPTAIFALMALAVLVVDHSDPVGTTALWFAAGAIAAMIIQAGWVLFENKKMLEESRHEALTDQVTGIPNRRQLMRDLQYALDGATIENPAVFAMFDLNGFKSFNDTFGHQAGDEMLYQLAQELQLRASKLGTAYRLGGDEFCVLANLNEEQAERFVHDALGALNTTKNEFPVTAAYGWVMVPGETNDISEALRTVDQRMYTDKQRNKPPTRRPSSDALAAFRVDGLPKNPRHTNAPDERRKPHEAA